MTRKPALTLESLETWLNENGIKVRRDLISHTIVVEGLSAAYNPETINNDLHIIVHNALKHEYICDRGLVADLLGVIAGKNRFNPVVDLLSNAPAWDGTDRINELYSILHIPENDMLSRVLLHKWLLQCLAMARNEIDGAYGADGLLVLQGAQGIGKTTFCKVIAVSPALVKLGQYLDTRDKDTLRRCTSCWICEWGEVETTLKSDLERLKAFITAEIDEYRLPYGRTDQRIARRTSLIATCNTPQFLIDPSGSRRFWTIPVTEIDLDRLAVFDALQLWKQIEIEVAADRQCFRLTGAEREALAKRNTEHEKPIKAQMEVEDIISTAKEYPSAFVWRYSTVSSFKKEHATLNVYSVEQIAKALDKVGIKSTRKTIEGKQCRARYLPHFKTAITSFDRQTA